MLVSLLGPRGFRAAMLPLRARVCVARVLGLAFAPRRPLAQCSALGWAQGYEVTARERRPERRPGFAQAPSERRHKHVVNHPCVDGMLADFIFILVTLNVSLSAQ